MVLGKLGIYVQKNELGLLPFTIHKNSFKIIKELSIRAKTVKLLEENIEEELVMLYLAVIS